MTSSAIRSIEPYDRFMTKANLVLGPKRDGKLHWLTELPIKELGLCNLLNSMDAGSPHTHDPPLQDWNPFSQRPIYELEPEIKDQFRYDFLRHADVTCRFLVLAHEAMHVLMWEPFFTGRMRPSKNNFPYLSLSFEGFCFWHTDIVVNAQIKTQAPDGESLFTRHSVSQPTVHPSKALSQLKLKDPRQIMDTYLKAFTGHETAFSENVQNPLIYNFAERFYAFYKSTLKPAAKMHSTLQDLGVFTDFFSRYCRVDDIPAALPGALLDENLTSQTSNYCWNVYTKGLPYLHNLNRQEIFAIRLRRSLQTRAYFAFSLKFLLENEHFLASSEFNKAATLQHLEDYLERLEDALSILSKSRAVAQVFQLRKKADQFFSRKVRAPLRLANVRSTRKELIYPLLPHHSRLQIGEDRSHLSPKTLGRFAQEVLNRTVIPCLQDADPSLIRDIRHLSQKILDLHGSMRSLQIKARSLSQALDQVLSHETILKNWSLRLDTIHPEYNCFQELIFHYK